MDRRDFVRTTAAGLTLSLTGVARGQAIRGPARQVMTVTGAVPADQLGTMLPHEHVLVDFIGAADVSADRYETNEVFEVMLPLLQRARERGCRAIAECTPAYLGRDPALLKRLSEASGVRLLTNTGYYGARQGKFLPEHTQGETPDELAARWTAEWENGIGDSGIRPGFIKTGVDAGPLTAVNRKLVQAAARCHLATGLAIASHTGDGQAALEQVEILREEGVPPGAWIWVHAQNERNLEIHIEVGRRGGWVEFDGISPSSVERHVELVRNMKHGGLLDRVLLSHDAGWYSVGEPRGGNVRGYDTLFLQGIPALKKAGLKDEQIRQLTVTNPARAFSLAATKPFTR